MPSQSQLESLVEKIEPAVADMHRPIVRSETAIQLLLAPGGNFDGPDGSVLLDRRSYDRLRYRSLHDTIEKITGRVTSFNMNTYNGRIYSEKEGRPIPFYLTPAGRTNAGVEIIGNSLADNIRNPAGDRGIIELSVRRTVSRTGRTTKYVVVGSSFEDIPFDDIIEADDPLLDD